tara:strand:- start:8692 stop:9969 length:1278 start_codon:yes stop_codon:yes gene_type:complete
MIEIYDLIKKLYPICRSLTGNGNRETLNIIKNIIPINIKEEPSGKNIYDWTVPKEWNIKDAYIKNKKGEKIINFKKHNLHIVNYSLPINKYISFKELKKNLYYLKDKPNWIPYITSYYKETWGFCLSYNDYIKMEEYGDDEEYQVFIDSTLQNGSLTYADLIIRGQTNKEILISTYICHPSMCNDNLSGLCLTTYLAKYLLENKNYYTYRFIFVPETIGSIIYIHNNFDILKKNVIGGYVITHVGDQGEFTYLKTRNENTIIDKITIFILDEMKQKYKIRNFLTCGSDERQYNFPGIDLNIGSIMKTKYTEFAEYHTSGDDLNFISKIALEESLNIYKKCIFLIENNKKYKMNILCEPFLSKYNLISDISGQSYTKHKNGYGIIKKLVYYLDGNNDIIDISKKIDEKYIDIIDNINLLIKNNIII